MTENQSQTDTTKMDSPEVIAARLKRLREAMGFRQQRMWCAFVDIPENTWNHFERGRRPITIEAAIKVAGKTGATLDWIFRGQEYALPGHLMKKLEQVPPEPPGTPANPSRLVSNG